MFGAKNFALVTCILELFEFSQTSGNIEDERSTLNPKQVSVAH